MKFKFVLTVALAGAAALTSFAQGGYQDGVDYYNADRFDDARTILQRTLNESATDKGLANYYLGAIALKEGNIPAADNFFQAGLAANPACAYNYIGLAEIALSKGDNKGAQALFADALKIDKKDAAINTAIARALFNADPVGNAKDINKYIQAAMKNSKNMSAEAYMLQGDMAKAEDIGTAASYYEQAMVYDEQAGRINPEAYVKYANVYIKVRPDFAINKLEELNAKLPTSALAQRELAEKYYDNEQYTKAAEQYAKYMKNPNHFQRDEQRYSQLLFFSEKYDEALALAKNVLKQDPSNAYMYRMVMLSDSKLGNYPEAVEYGAKLFDQNKVELTTMDYNTYADALQQTGKPAEAIAVYEAGYNANPSKNSDMLAAISSLYTDLEDYAKAAEYQQRYVDLGDVKLQDLFTLSNRYRNLAISLPADAPARAEAAQNGIKYLDQALETAATPIPLLRSRAIMLQLRDGQETVGDELAQTCLNLLDALNADPENLTTNHRDYKTAYALLSSYHAKRGEKAEAQRYADLFNSVAEPAQ